MRGGRDEIGSWCHPPCRQKKMGSASASGFSSASTLVTGETGGSSVESRCEPPNNGAVVEIVAYLKIEMEKGAFSPFSSRRFISLTTEEVSIFGNEQKERKKRTEEKNYFCCFFFSFSFFFNSHNRVSFFGDHAGCCRKWRCEEVG